MFSELKFSIWYCELVSNKKKNSSLTSLTSPTSKFFESEPGPFVSAGGPVTGVHGDEMVLAVTTLPETKQNLIYFK